MSDQQNNWWQRLKQGLKKTSDQLGSQIRQLTNSSRLDAQTLDNLEDLLIQADMGVNVAGLLRNSLATKRLNQLITEEEIKTLLADDIEKILFPVAKPLVLTPTADLQIILIVGVNGVGKTTTISKLTQQWQQQGLRVEWAACDTFRAAAVEQLKIWGQRLNVPVHSGLPGADAASLAFNAINNAKATMANVLCIDTAGRLHNKEGLMDELQKIVRVIKKNDPTAPHNTILVLDATTGQNAYQQVEAFKQTVAVDGLIMTKLDGTARGGVLIGLAQKFKLPIYALGVGETAADLQPFIARNFANSLLGLEQTDSN